MKWIIAIVICGLCSHANVLTFSPHSVVSDTVFRVKDIARAGHHLPAHIANRIIGTTAPAGYKRFFVPTMLCTQLKEFGLSCRNASERIAITTASDSISYAAIFSRVKKDILHHSGWDETQCEFELENGHEQIRFLPGSNLEYTFAPRRSQRYFGRESYTVGVQSSRAHTPIQLQITAHVRVSIAVTRRQLQRGEPLGADGVEPREVDLAAYSRVPVLYDQLGSRALALRSLPAGQVLYAHHLQIATAVQRGEQKRLAVQSGSVKISVPVTCRQNGRVGEIILVENSLSNTTLRARVGENGELHYAH